MDSIKSAKDDLMKSLQEIGAKMYQQAAPQGAPQGAPEAGPADSNNGDPNVYDADYKDVD